MCCEHATRITVKEGHRMANKGQVSVKWIKEMLLDWVLNNEFTRNYSRLKREAENKRICSPAEHVKKPS